MAVHVEVAAAAADRTAAVAEVVVRVVAERRAATIRSARVDLTATAAAAGVAARNNRAADPAGTARLLADHAARAPLPADHAARAPLRVDLEVTDRLLVDRAVTDLLPVDPVPRILNPIAAIPVAVRRHPAARATVPAVRGL